MPRAIEVLAQGVAPERIRVERRVHLRYEGTDSALVVASGTAPEMARAFEAAYRKRYSFLMPGRRLIAEAVSVEAIGASDAPDERPPDVAPRSGPPERAAVVDDVHRRHAPLHAGVPARRPRSRRPHRRAGDHRRGERDDGRGAGLGAEVTPAGHLVLARVAARPASVAIGTSVDPVMLEIFNNLFMSIAEQMGFALANTAYSVNIKERLDFSCALFDAAGNLIANAPHMPVHLGLDGRVDPDRDPGERRAHAPGRRVHAQRAVQRRHASPGHHGDHAGIRWLQGPRFFSTSVRAAITRTSAG